jgi:hypothetical protein
MPFIEVVRGEREGGARAGARRLRAWRGVIAGIFMIMWIPQLICCRIPMIMVRAAIAPGQTWTERAGAGRA